MREYVDPDFTPKQTRWIVGGVLAIGLYLVLTLGCVATQPKVRTTVNEPVSKCWHPETKREMEGLIGNTVLKAIHQYNQRLIELQKRLEGHSEKPSSKLRLEPKPV